MDAKLREHAKRMIEMAKALPKMEIVDCPKCGGTGDATVLSRALHSYYLRNCLIIERCPDCGGTGTIIKEVNDV